MANSEAKLPENVPGKYYVDEDCTFCDVCVEFAPENLAYHEEEDYVFVKKQPETEEEEDSIQEAIDTCPSQAIGDDG
ncbi:MAG: ferredoxin [SAR324 cluster bacterium]|nr:ferredoxin [SAR324 cluster bacterium]